jgi:hypothetical protein
MIFSDIASSFWPQVARVITAFNPPLWTAGMQGYSQTLNLADASIYITTPQYSLRVFADANSNTVYIMANATTSTLFSVTTTLDVYRNATVPANNEQACRQYMDNPDTVVDPSPASLGDAVVWYHRNIYVGGINFFNDTMWGQGVNPDLFPDPFINKTFGGALFGSAGVTKTSNVSLSGSGLSTVTLTVVALTTQPAVVDTWLTDLEAAYETQSPLAIEDVYAAHVQTWSSIWNRSYVDIAPRAGSDATQSKLILSHMSLLSY